jgi:beta-RFAP synthase
MNDSTADDLGEVADRFVRVTTGARLHFGLLDTVAPFGGVGLMIDRPKTEIVIRPAESFQCPTEVSDRVVGIAQRIAGDQRKELPHCAVEIRTRPQPHSGLGSGTQLSLAVTEGLAKFCSLTIPPEDLACRIADRGKRSAVGVHGYFQGGLIYEDVDHPGELNAIKERVEIEQQWCVALFRSSELSPPVSGHLEQNHFHAVDKASTSQHRLLTSIINQQLIPAAVDRNFLAFSAAIRQYNHESGLLFQNVQGGPYNGPIVSELIGQLIDRGAQGVGQSSWGPTVFAWFENSAQVAAFEQSLPGGIQLLTVAKVLNGPRTLTTSPR